MKILVTGGNGYIGYGLVANLSEKGHDVLGTCRRGVNCRPSEAPMVLVGDLGSATDWQQALQGREVVIHTAARVHQMRESATDPYAEYRRVNVEGTTRLARQAAECGVRRFVFLSSIKVNGEYTERGRLFTAGDAPDAKDPYGRTKAEAESELFRLSEETGMEVTVIRPPLVYGPGVKANFLSMMKWLNLGLPLPLGAIKNLRSMVALANLIDLIRVCIDHPSAANRVLLAGDGEDLSTTDLLRRLGKAMGKPARLLPIPPGLLMVAASAIGKGSVAQRLCRSLQVDITETRKALDWVPPLSVDQALRIVANDFYNSHPRKIGA